MVLPVSSFCFMTSTWRQLGQTPCVTLRLLKAALDVVSDTASFPEQG